MRTSKQTLILCVIITIISLAAVTVLHEEIDIWAYEKITLIIREYDINERNFYESIWCNIFAGGFVAMLTSFVSYGRAKNDIEFSFETSQRMLTMGFQMLSTPMYALNLKNPKNNHIAINRFIDEVKSIHTNYNTMIEASNDYCPFFKTKKVKTLQKGKLFLQAMWLDICSIEEDILICDDDASLKKAIDKTRDIILIKEFELENLDYCLWQL